MTITPAKSQPRRALGYLSTRAHWLRRVLEEKKSAKAMRNRRKNKTMKRTTWAWRLLSTLIVLMVFMPTTMFRATLPAAQAADSGWRSPSADAADTGGDGDGFEELPTEAYADGGDYARNMDGFNDRHRYYDFGFDPSALPVDAAITGIEVRLDGWADSTSNSPRYDVELSWDGGSNWSSIRSTSYLATSESTFYLGDQSDLWGRPWTAGDFADANFQVRITSRASGFGRAARDFFLDWVVVRVYYATARIRGTVWSDGNADGIQDSGEAGLSNVHVTIYRDDGDSTFEGGTEDPEVGSDDTNTSGVYETGPFLEGFSYWISVNEPADYSLTTPPEPRLVSLPDGNSVEANFGYQPGAATPAIAIAKTPDSQTVRSGSTVTFTIAVTNTGDVPLTNVTVSDVLAPDCDRIFAELAAGENQRYTCTRTNVTADFTNSATVSGTPPVGAMVIATDTASVDVINPAIQIAKTPDVQMVRSGTPATFTIAVTNTGDVALSGVQVADDLVPACARAIGNLARGASTHYQCTQANVTTDLTNMAAVSGLPPVGPVVTATDTAFVDVITPAIQIAKMPDTQMALSGSMVTFTIAVTNTSDAALSNVQVTDALVPSCSANLGSLDAGSASTFTCSQSNATASFTNLAIVTGTPPVGPVVTDTDMAAVTVIHPSLAIAKTPDTQMVRSGSTVTFTVAITNTGDVSLPNVVVSDALAPNCTRTIGGLDLGGSTRYECAHTSVTADFTNTVIVSGTPPAGTVVTATDTAFVDVIGPAIKIAKTPDMQRVASGSTVTFTIAVTNTGDTNLTNVHVSDAQATACANFIGTLAAGAGIHYTCTVAHVTTSFTNTATVTGTPPVGVAVTDTDSAIVKRDNSLVCPVDMIAYWKLDEANGPPYADFYDGHDGVCTGQCPSSVAGHINGGQAFNGNSTGIDVPVHDAFNWNVNDSFSIEFWMQTSSVSTCSGNEVIVGRDEDSNPLHWWVGCQEGGQAAFYLRDKSGTLAGVEGTADLTDGDWHHIVAERDGSENKLRIYVDGAEQGSTAATYAGDFDSPTAELNIGWLDALHGYHFEGNLDEVAIYKRRLATVEIRQHYFDGLAGRWYCEAGAPAPDIVTIFLPIILKSR